MACACEAGIDGDAILEAYVQLLINAVEATNDDNVLRASLPPVPIVLQQEKYPILLDMYCNDDSRMRNIILRLLHLIACDVLSRREEHLHITPEKTSFIDLVTTPCTYPNLAALAQTILYTDEEGSTLMYQAIANNDAEILSLLPATEVRSSPYSRQ